MNSVQEQPHISFISGKIKIQKLHPKAEYPQKERVTDVGYKITLVSRTENRAEDETNDVNDFGTGLILSPPDGYYLEIMALGSLHKHGYMLATGTSVVNPDQTGELIIPLYKFREGSDLELPFSAVQLVVKEAVYAHPSAVSNLTYTDKSVESFGQTLPPQQMNGMYLQMPNTSYVGDMGAYQSSVKGYQRGVPRPQAAPPRSNHMF